MSSFNENRLYAEIECLKQRNAELAAQAEEVAKALQDKQIIIDHLKGELMRALSQYDMTAAHNVELKAQVEHYKEIARQYTELTSRGIYYTLDEIQAHDAEVVAKTIVDVINAHKNKVMTFGFDTAIRVNDLIKYANKIKSGEVKV